MNTVRNKRERGYGSFAYLGYAQVLFISFTVFALSVPRTINATDFLVSNVSQLINAINDANNEVEHPGTDTITMAADTYTLPDVYNDTTHTDGPTGLPSIRSNITIKGAGADTTIIERSDSEPFFRIFHVADTGTLELDGLTVMRGATATERVPEDSEHDGGGIRNLGKLTIKNSTVSDNMAGDDAGGIYNAGTAIITSSIISNNIAHSSCGGIWNLGTMTIINSTISSNQSIGRTVSAGGGIGNNGDLTLSSCTVKDNADNGGTGGGGGGIINHSGNLTINNTDISGNYSVFEGGGIHHRTGTMTIINSTIANNTVPYHDGGGIWVNFLAQCLLINCTVSENSAGRGGGGIASPVGNTSVKIQNTIIAGNTASQGAAQDCFGDIISLGNNLIGNTTGSHVNIILQPSDLTGDSGLGAFTDDGTPGNGHFPLLSTSPAVDAGANDVYQDYPDTQTDQLGNPRTDGNGDGSVVCDIGAVEYPGIVNDFVRFVRDRSTYVITTDTTDCPPGFVGKFSFGAKLTNKSSSPPLTGLVVLVKTLTNGNLLHNADGGDGGEGATMTIPLTADAYADGVLSPGESVDVTFIICLTESKSFVFVVDVLGFETEEQTDQEVTSADASQVKKQLKKTKSRTKGKRFFGRFRP